MSDLEFHVLLALGEGPSHGYAIGKAVEDQSNGQLDPTTGALYQVLRRLSDEELIAAVPTPKETDPTPAVFLLDPARATRGGRRGGTPRRVGENGAETTPLPATGVMSIYRWLLRIAAPSLARDYGAAMEDMFAARLAGAQTTFAPYHGMGSRAAQPPGARVVGSPTATHVASTQGRPHGYAWTGSTRRRPDGCGAVPRSRPQPC